MNREEIRKMAEMEDRHWWFRGSRSVILSILHPLLPRGLPLLDIGCGTGLTLARLEHACHLPPTALFGVDRSTEALAAARRKTSASLSEGHAENLPHPDGSFGVVMLLDVLEHLLDDAAALAEASRVTRPGGHVLVTVPAHPRLYSAHDRALGHCRRYRRDEVVALASRAGLRVVRLTPYNCLLAPPIVLARLGRRLARTPDPESDLRMPAGPVNRLLASLLACEARLLRCGNLPFGISFLGLFQKVS